jgi:hypothetical protein
MDKLKALRAKYEALPKTVRGAIPYVLVFSVGVLLGGILF